ncbi:MAG: hypothetical protein K6G58_04615 [Lachnospiraceae bacterium]|nr:hypothetical protein [Lachnospiraceae bacterium]
MRFTCNNTYKADEQILNETVFEKYGYSSPSSERETICLALTGNRAALKSYADLLFYRKIRCRNNYRKAFPLYCEAAGIDFTPEGITCSGDGTPLAFYVIGYYLVNYRCESVLKKCELIEEIENLTRNERLSLALDLAKATLSACKSPAAVNLIGRIIKECPALSEKLEEDATAEDYFEDAAEGGYIYACNNLAAKEADLIVKGEGDIDEHARSYIHYLTISADRYEPYAANRLGLFYMTGEVRASSGDKVYLHDYINIPFAKKYFNKATVYPDSNSAWAYFNLIKYFHKDYDTDIELLNEHMDCIKDLNPAVYDEAIEL